MFESEELDNHLRTSHTIKTESVIFAEWNMNDSGNVEKLGNYRYRPDLEDNKFSLLPATYDAVDEGGYYTGATQADITIQYGFDDQDQPTLFTTKNEKMSLLYSLEDCIKPHRPRSGINKLLYLGDSANQYLDIGDKVSGTQELLSIARRPRYYMSSRSDQFKYWTSYRTENVNGEQQEFGVSRESANGIYYIHDASPFVVYKEEIPTNKIVIKMQTNVGEVNLGPFRFNNQQTEDPLYGFDNQTTPQKWKVEILEDDNWVEIISFDSNSKDENNQPVIKSDGYVEVSYGLELPTQYRDVYVYAGELESETLLPEQAVYGYTFLIKETEDELGVLKIWDGQAWDTITPQYNWQLSKQGVDVRTSAVTKITDPEYFINESGFVQFREFQFIRGMRIVAETMNVPECTFDLIEFSPRLFADISEKVSSISISKVMSDLGNSSVPVGSIFASTGSMELFDEDFSFNSNNYFDSATNTGSIIAKYADMRAKFNFYQAIREVDGYDFFVPLKTMYTDEIPAVSSSTGIISISLRDLFFNLESSKAPELLMTDVSISYAITLLMDHMGFSNYVFRRISDVPEIIIPFFFISPDQNVAEVLQQLAISSQTAIFFDEYNNLVVMSKEYLLPTEEQRETDSTLYGQEFEGNLPNIINLSSEEKRVYNEGRINYTTRYIQREISKYRQSPYVEKFKTYGYKPVLLWEVSGKETLRTKNELSTQSQGYTLSAAPLNTSLSNNAPTVENNQIVNNVIDLGENVDAGFGGMSSYQGYLYANGEIIRYDAIEYAIAGSLNDDQTGNIRWITSNQEYQRYFSSLSFNGKMYPTGNVRIYVEPEYETIDNVLRMKNGLVKKHGRGQFGTPITTHDAGLDQYWLDNANAVGCIQSAKDYLFNTDAYISYPESLSSIEVAGKTKQVSGLGFFDSDDRAKASFRTGIIKNFKANKYYTEKEVNYFSTAQVGTMQSSALVFTGPAIPSQIKPSEFVSYIYKELDAPYKHFGTRMRIIGKIESTNQKSETPFGAFPIYQTQDLNVDNPEKNIQILGGAGGLAFGLNKEKNTGYYFEIISLTQDNIDQYTNSSTSQYSNYDILSTPAPSCVSNIVTAVTKTEIKFVVGQKILVNGMVDSLNPLDTRTPLNGEYVVTAINNDKKTFQYTIPGESISNRTSTTGASLRIEENAPRNISNVYFYKVLSDKKQTKFQSYSINSGVLTLNLDKESRFEVGERIILQEDLGLNLAGDYVVLSTSNRTITVPTALSNKVLTETGPSAIINTKDPVAIPYKLWSGTANIVVDDGKFTGQYRFVGEETPTVYDLSAEYENISGGRRFYLYINGSQIATVNDTDPLLEYNNMAVFVRGSSKCMFENVYAIGANISDNSKVPVATPVSKIWGDDEIDASESLRKYAVSGMIQKTYLSGINSEGSPSHILYFDEFGTIMREAAYLNIKYDRAYPALYARMMKTYNRLKGYVVSGFYAGSYGADFLIFNCTDTNINLDDTTGNFLRIQGIAFTQNTSRTLSVDDYYKRVSSISDPIFREDNVLVNPFVQREEYNRIINSRSRYGINEFTIESDYIQTQEAAEDIFGWVIDKVSKPKILVGINTFATFNMQLGDIVNINYKNNEDLNVISDSQKRFVVYNIGYNKSLGDESMTMYLAEV